MPSGCESLSQTHLADLRRSGLSDGTIKAAGIYSLSAETMGKALGRRRVSAGYAIPYPPLGNAKPLTRYRLDQPAVCGDGRPAKYLAPKGSSNRIYAPATLPPGILGDPSRPLLVTEGEKKSLASTQEGFPCLGLGGVCSWQGKTNGRSGPIPDLDAVIWEGRSVYIAFDSDLAAKQEVQVAEWKLAQELRRRGAVVMAIRLPGGPDGAKVGLDDFLVQRGEQGRADLQALLGAAEEAQPPKNLTYPYCVQKGCLGHLKASGAGQDASEVFVSLANFTARVVEERTVSDGLTESKALVIEGQVANGTPLPRIVVSAEEFSSMRWVVQRWGVRASVSAGQGNADRLRAAIQAISTDVRHTAVFTHTGWVELDGRWVYLHAGSAEAQVELPLPLDRYRLPSPVVGAREAALCSLQLLAVAPDTVTFPLLAVVHLAPLSHWLRPNLTVYLFGSTGSFKTTLAALFLAHFGAFVDGSPPASFESTGNSLERVLAVLKDVVAVVDDYAPQADGHAQQEMARKAQRLLRGVGNQTGRGRLNTDLSARPEYVARSIPVLTGEDLPPGHSIQARTVAVMVERLGVDVDALTRSQQQAERLPHALAAYIEWLRPQLDSLPQQLRQRLLDFRGFFGDASRHPRSANNLSYLALGVDLALSFALDQGAVDEVGAIRLAERALEALLALGDTHAATLREADCGEVFLTTLRAMIVQNSVNLQPLDLSLDNRPFGMIGWQDGSHAYLIPEAAQREVTRFQRDAGNHYAPSAHALYAALEAGGALVKGADGKATTTKKIGGRTARVLKVPLGLLEGDGGVPESGQTAAVAARTHLGHQSVTDV